MKEFCLDFGSIRCVPSVHWSPFFASSVLRRFSEVKPEAIAVELVPEALEPYIRAVQRFPRLSALVSDDDQLYPVIPTDSIAQAVRLALEHGLPLYAIDTPRFAPHEGDEDIIAPPALGDTLGLEDYYRVAAPLVAEAPPGSPDDRREAFMAEKLRELGCDHESLLVVMGLAHWEPIKARLGRPPSRTVSQAAPQFDLVHLTARAAYHFTNQTPFLIASFERHQRRDAFHTEHAMARLFVEAARSSEIRLGPGDHRILQRYARNLVQVENRLSPTLFELTLSAKANLGDAFGAAVYEKGLHYPWDAESNGLPSLEVSREGSATVAGLQRSFTLCVPGKFRPISDLDGLAAAGSEPPTHPDAEKLPKRLRHDNFGRFTEECLREERFLQSLERLMLHHKTPDDYTSEPFTTGLRDGIDIRSTIRDPQRRHWVKVHDPTPARLGALLVSWTRDDSADSAYTYAAHRGLGLYSNRGPVRHGVDACDWTTLVTFFRRITKEKLFEVYDEWLTEGETFDSLQRLTVQYSRGDLVLFVSPSPPTRRLHLLAEKLGKRLVHASSSSLPRALLDQGNHHHIYWRS